MNARAESVRLAIRRALEVRRDHGIDLTSSLCVYDVVEAMGIDLRFVEMPSLEGAYVRTDGRTSILVNARRPTGRQAFTCAHELGHHVFGHGTRVDAYIEHAAGGTMSPDELQADCFAAHLLMPKSAVLAALHNRPSHPENCSSHDAYAVSGALGVGYSSLLTHMRSGLRILSEAKFHALASSTPKAIRKDILGFECDGDCVIVDRNWPRPTIDVRTGDVILLAPRLIAEGSRLRPIAGPQGATCLRAVAAGIQVIRDPETSWSSFVRVSRLHYTGFATYRYLEEPDEY